MAEPAPSPHGVAPSPHTVVSLCSQLTRPIERLLLTRYRLGLLNASHVVLLSSCIERRQCEPGLCRRPAITDQYGRSLHQSAIAIYRADGRLFLAGDKSGVRVMGAVVLTNIHGVHSQVFGEN